MPVSIFDHSMWASIDGVTPTTPYGASFQIGVVDLGGGKTVRRRALLEYDLLGAAASGLPLKPTDTITAVDYLFTVSGVVGTSGLSMTASRLTRDDWDTTATWNEYKTGSAWTAAGGDASTPTTTYTSPTATGAWTLSAPTNFVTDALASRAGLLEVIHKLTTEPAGQISTWTASDVQLQVTYTRRRVFVM